MTISAKRKAECIEQLRKYLKPGSVVYTSLKHVSKSGMYRVINLRVFINNEPIRLDGYAADLLEGYDNKHEGCRSHGCGMDMGFHLVMHLSYALFRDGFICTGKNCPSNDHFNGDRNYKRHKHTSGGYALEQRWL